MLTNGARTNKARVSLRSIRRTMGRVKLRSEIIVAGVIAHFRDEPDLRLVAAERQAREGRIAAVRNAAGERARYDTIVFLDDDIVFSRDWARRLVDWSQGNAWDVLGHRILLPDGGRYWDKATIDPHRLVDYDTETDALRYQTGCLWIMRKRVFQQQRWDPAIRFYAEHSGGQNEDVEYSMRLQDNGFHLAFDAGNVAWHNDDDYVQSGDSCTLKSLLPAVEPV